MKKLSGTTLGKYLIAVANREAKIDSALSAALKAGRSAKRSVKVGRNYDPGADSVSAVMSKLRGHVSKPLSTDIIEAAKLRGLSLDDSARRALNRPLRQRPVKGANLTGRSFMRALGEHVTFLQKTTRNPVAAIRAEAKEKAKWKTKNSKLWDDFAKKLKPAAQVKRPPSPTKKTGKRK